MRVKSSGSLALLLIAVGAARAEGATTPVGACRVVIVRGMPGAPVYARRYDDWVKRFRSFFMADAGVPEANVTVLSGDDATAERFTRELARAAKDVRPADQFVLIVIGHGAVGDMMPTIVLPGPDLSAKDLGQAAEGISAQNQVILNFVASSGDFVKFLAKPGRVNIAATSPAEVNEPVYAEFFLRGLESKRADDDSDGTTTLLEAYHWAAHQTALWIVRQKSTKAGWLVHGRESVEIFKKLCTGAADEPAARALSPRSNAEADDAVMPFRPPGGKIDREWRGRRAITEHALLEDCGEETGATALRGKGFEPLGGKAKGEPGYLARRVVLGRAELLPAGGK